MTTLSPNYYAYPLMGTNCNADGINPTEIINYLFKKQLGFANTNKIAIYNAESTLYNSYNPTTTNLLFSQFIPPIPPRDLIEVPFCNVNTLARISGQAKYISSNYPYLGFYSNVFMNRTTPAPTNSNSFTICNNTNNTFSNFLTTNAVPYSYGIGNSYKNAIRITSSNLSNLSFSGSNDGAWIFDTDSGVLTFYDTPSRTGVFINATTPPRISFWRYEGLIGNNAIMNIADF
jgi:hypothetical protein